MNEQDANDLSYFFEKFDPLKHEPWDGPAMRRGRIEISQPLDINAPAPTITTATRPAVFGYMELIAQTQQMMLEQIGIPVDSMGCATDGCHRPNPNQQYMEAIRGYQQQAAEAIQKFAYPGIEVRIAPEMMFREYKQVGRPKARTKRTYKYFLKNKRYWGIVETESVVLINGVLLVGKKTFELLKTLPLYKAVDPSYNLNLKKIN